jgi:uncharacterized delta-60 repeat protein
MKKIILLLFTGICLISFGQQFKADLTFNTGIGFDQGVTDIITQQDGKIIVGGRFELYGMNTTYTRRIARLNSNGSLDNTFNTGSGFDNDVTSLAIQTDGKIVVGGEFSSFNGIARNRIARLNNDGSLDTTFNPGSGFFNGFDFCSVYSISIQSDDKLIVGGGFSSFNGVSRKCIARLNNDGSLDATFNPGSGFFNQFDFCNVSSTSIQFDGKLIVGGGFSSFNGIGRNNILRLNSDGSLDNTFNPGSGFDTGVSSTAIQSDGKLIVGGGFTSFNGISRNGITRLNSDGSIDNSFNIGSGCSGSIASVLSLAIQTDGKILIGGLFTSFNGINNKSIARLNINGTLDNSFNTGTGFIDSNNGTEGLISSILTLSDDKFVATGEYSSFNGVNRNKISRIIDCSSNSSNNIANVTVCDLTVIQIGNQNYATSNSYTWPLNGETYYETGQYNTNITINSVGCDSVNTLDLNFHQNWRETSILACYLDTFYIDGYGYISNQSGYFFSYSNQPALYGCDSLVIYDLTSISPIYNSFNVSICPGSSYTWNGQQYNSDGQFQQTFSSSITGCDSIVTLNLSYTMPVYSSFDVSICPSSSYIWNGQQYNSPGQYQQSFSSFLTGCDSISTLNLSFIPNNFNPTFSSAQQLYTAPPFAVQFTNSTANAANYSFTWDFGDGTTLASNNASVFHQYLYNGQYTVSLIATSNTTGCSDTTTLSDYIFCTGGVSCTHTAAISQTSPQQACQGVPLWLTCNNDQSFTYQWRRNGVTIPGNNNDSLAVTQSGTYYVAILVNNCPVNSNDVVVNLLTAPSTPIITSSGAIQPCVGGSVTLNAGNYTTYNWSTGATTQSINVTSSGTYSVSVTGANGCSSSSAPFNVNASFVAPPQVCIVGMDSLTNENRIVWEKPLTLGIDSFYVYKESNVSNVYTKIGATDYNQLAVFLDANSNPAVQAYRYKISALDTCGVETNVGDFHKTIHLTINQGVGNSWNLIWSHYEGLTFGSYRIYRGTSLSNMALLTTIQSNLNSYTDLTPPTGPLYYQIEVVNPNNCDPTKIMNYGLSKSNIVDNGVIGISEEVLSTINVYPNPTNDKFTLNVSNDLLGKGYVITDFSGRIISKGKINSLIQTIDVQEISKGAYFLQIDKSTTKAIKIIKQ